MAGSKIHLLSRRSADDLKITFESNGEAVSLYVNLKELAGKTATEKAGALASELGCALCCSRKSGFAACLARCLYDGRCCDGGTNNCEDA
jgi:hypothetical protein